mmetsp:Transcript_42660/g.138373  ORF Transcript_42660/g.138373 Transcript_42660/m.138373 type:complete len:234 (+) Transcript_42660:947-1648(+)
MPSGEFAMRPPTMKAVAIPTWLKLIAVAVASARSEEPNQVADRSGGVHWKKGCAMPTRIVPATSQPYPGMTSIAGSTNGMPERSRQPPAIIVAAPVTTFLRPRRAAMSVKRKQDTTLEARKMSISSAASCPSSVIHSDGTATVAKHVQSLSRASIERMPSCTQRCGSSASGTEPTLLALHTGGGRLLRGASGGRANGSGFLCRAWRPLTAGSAFDNRSGVTRAVAASRGVVAL